MSYPQTKVDVQVKDKVQAQAQAHTELYEYYLTLTSFRETLKLFHFQCKRFAQHKASDEVLADFDKLYDNLFETCQGIVGRVQVVDNTLSIKVNANLSVQDMNKVTDFVIDQLTLGFYQRWEWGSGVLNIRDELIGLLEKFKYLLTFD
jgi:hypothetical protein